MILVAAVSGECGHGSVFYSWVSYIVMCVRVDGRGWPNEDDLSARLSAGLIAIYFTLSLKRFTTPFFLIL